MSAGAAYGRLRTARTLSNVVRFWRDAPEPYKYLISSQRIFIIYNHREFVLSR